ncbi:P-loop containing nucleoside triphosphate hydrolase protein [Annulohypoxylon maeteangense]|uniref:P-loop containing nucleoside triphosphate hydrolase protein n=1 Tax=Annulohypoxylon maeteangense TaxID=1927788 RepID=UPI0020074D75|nr:P-loop containing nucleoside triphosphate hydrolase protein [Annulohypoxylon maeteangense]KAI0881424.1 P-loop containing nucleoside triphosphate hydrolase protein [Annulohypoxylon maeteangense]
MDDTSSTASFEEIGPSIKPFEPSSEFSDEDKNVRKLRALVEKSVINDGTSGGLAEDEVPDVCYVLQYKGWGGKLIDVRRSHEPIKVQLDEMNEEVSSSTKKPILEIVTKVSTTVIQQKQPGRRPPLPQHPRWNPRFDYNGFDDFSYQGGPPRRPGGIDESTMKVAKVETTCMVINSTHLINALKAVVGYYPSVSFIGETLTINAPYHVLVHHKNDLALFKVNQPTTHDVEYASTTAKHIDILLDFLEKTLGDQIREEEKRHNSSIPSATFDKLGLIFKPGEVIYAKQDYKWTPFVLSIFTEGYTNNQGAITPHHIVCWNISYSAERLCRTMHSFSIDPFSGEETISNLSVIPARFFRGIDWDLDPMQVKERQIELGKMVWELSEGPRYMCHDGSLADRDPNFSWSYPVSANGYMSGRVIVDQAGFARYSLDCPGENHRRGRSPPPPNRPPIVKDTLPYLAPCCGCSACSKANKKDHLSPFAAFEDLDPTFHDAPDQDLYYIVLNKVVSGFILGERRWGHFNVEHLREVQFDKDAFKYLVLDNEIKLTVRSLIGKFASEKGRVAPWPNDFVQNKGQGRIFLLHGSPGVGKTCTAECVAELTNRPLLSLTSGDLSTNSYQVEKNLEYFLQLGERFGAMVLLDEADVYLEARRAKDIARNGLVSIFLRALEYYRGVLFLTTNRVQTFDSAFTSRIHVALHYHSLTDTDREKIWINSFERLERDSGGKVHVGLATREYAYESRDVKSLRWNGREIRNALQTAVALAETEALEDGIEKVSVTDKHLKAVVKMSRGFKNFLRSQKLKGDAEVEDDDDENEEEIEDGNSSDIYE